MKIAYYKWVDGFDGGEGSEKFKTEEEATSAMYDHCSNIRLTKSELEKMKRECGDFVQVCGFNEDDEVVIDCEASVDINEKTALIY